MAKSLRAPGRWHVTSRVIAALIPGFVLVNAFGIALALILANFIGWSKFDAVAFSTLWSFAFYTAVVMWIFSVKTLRKVWLTLLAGLVVTGGLAYGLLVFEGTL
ncbi:MAG: hypothetical protein AAF431_18885 [Pseudomonadota bacterium]